jgi:hypothetical protein
VEVMASVLRTMVRSRIAHKVKKDPASKLEELEQESLSHSSNTTVIDEVAECIVLPVYDMTGKALDEAEVILDTRVRDELRNYVQTIAGQWLSGCLGTVLVAEHGGAVVGQIIVCPSSTQFYSPNFLLCNPSLA